MVQVLHTPRPTSKESNANVVEETENPTNKDDIDCYTGPESHSSTESKDVQRLLGVCNDIRAHVPHETTWKIQNVKSFSCIINSKFLSTPDPTLEFFLATVSSNYGLRTMPFQQDGNTIKFISFYSRSLNTAERKYHAHKKELMGLLFGLLKKPPIATKPQIYRHQRPSLI